MGCFWSKSTADASIQTDTVCVSMKKIARVSARTPINVIVITKTGRIIWNGTVSPSRRREPR